ncbi:type III PLP-dependent enzyme [Actinacidiphila yeochonensis]|uniref:type III PLP-dependent enzyme n=1 Tax=Actinacidiphila yeochonensis TaxID=89050 RepID=UPI00099B37A5|nr:type III PLP-dependent enzyme [Actinacidiphila yeochonensis]
MSEAISEVVPDAVPESASDAVPESADSTSPPVTVYDDPSSQLGSGALSAELRAGLAAAEEDRIVLDLGGVRARYTTLVRELPGVDVRFAMKSCPVQEVVGGLARLGAGVDAASPREIEEALRAGVPVDRVHYGNTVKSDENIAAAHRLGVSLFATDSPQDLAALARIAPGARVFVRLATDGHGSLWGLTGKFGCSAAEAVALLERARGLGLVPSGVSVHVGSQQMTAEAWQAAFERIADVLGALAARGVALDHVNLGGGLPAQGYLDRYGRQLDPPLDKILRVIREGMHACRQVPGHDLGFVMEPGRHLVADSGAVRARVARMTTRRGPDGEPHRWLFLSCGRFNGLYEMDQVQYRLVFPTHPGADTVPAVVAGPTCDSDDAFGHDGPHGLVRVPRALASGDPVWVLSAGAYAVSYTTMGFNGFDPLPYVCVGGAP